MKKFYSLLLVAIITSSFPGYLETVNAQDIVTSVSISDDLNNSMVADTIVPEIICPSSITIELSSSDCMATNVDLGAPIVNDNSGIKSVINDAPTSFPVGLNVVSWVVTDINGNVNFCNQYVLVTNQNPPQISSPSSVVSCADQVTKTKVIDQIQPTIPEQCPYTLSYNLSGATTASGACNTADQLNGFEFNIGTTLVTYTITNLNSWKTSSCSFNVEILPCTESIIEATSPDSFLSEYTFVALPGNPENSELIVNAYPNPATEIINIQFQLPENELVKIEVYKMTGMKVLDVLNTSLEKGYNYKIELQTSALGMSGIYFLKLRTGNQVKTAKIVVVD